MNVSTIIYNEQTVFHDLLATRTRPLLRLMCWGHDTGFSESPALWYSSRSSLRFFLSPTCWIAAWTLENYDSHDSLLITHLYKYLRLLQRYFYYLAVVWLCITWDFVYFLFRAMKYFEGHSYWVGNFKSVVRKSTELVSGLCQRKSKYCRRPRRIAIVYSAVECWLTPQLKC